VNKSQFKIFVCRFPSAKAKKLLKKFYGLEWGKINGFPVGSVSVYKSLNNF